MLYQMLVRKGNGYFIFLSLESFKVTETHCRDYFMDFMKRCEPLSNVSELKSKGDVTNLLKKVCSLGKPFLVFIDLSVIKSKDKDSTLKAVMNMILNLRSQENI